MRNYTTIVIAYEFLHITEYVDVLVLMNAYVHVGKKFVSNWPSMRFGDSVEATKFDS